MEDLRMGTHKVSVVAVCSIALSFPAVTGAGAQAPQLAYCKADAQRLCQDVRPGGGRIEACLKTHENEMSVGCAKELKQLKNARSK
jgi:hypothetical protein